MADWKITLTRAVIVKGAQRAIQLDHVVEDMDRNLAIIEGVDKLLRQASQGETPIVPLEAVKYWNEVRASGNLQVYEILSNLETQWGLSFGSQEANAAEPSPQPQPRNGHVEEVSDDLDSMLKNQLKVLQARNVILNTNIDKMTAERDKNDANIMRISMFLKSAFVVEAGTLDIARIEAGPIAAISPARKPRGPKPKEQPHAE